MEQQPPRSLSNVTIDKGWLGMGGGNRAQKIEYLLYVAAVPARTTSNHSRTVTLLENFCIGVLFIVTVAQSILVCYPNWKNNQLVDVSIAFAIWASILFAFLVVITEISFNRRGW